MKIGLKQVIHNLELLEQLAQTRECPGIDAELEQEAKDLLATARGMEARLIRIQDRLLGLIGEGIK